MDITVSLGVDVQLIIHFKERKISGPVYWLKNSIFES